MDKLYLHLHNANNNFKKQFLSFGLLLFLLLHSGTRAAAQCIPAPTVNAVTNQAACNKALTTAIIFTGTATSYNWVNTTTSIGLGASGTGDIVAFTALNATATPVVATITVTPVTGACTGTPISFTITVNPSPVVAVTPIASCGTVAGGPGPCNPITASGADSYTWSPVTGLYTNCAFTIPYTGGNVATVYAAPAAYTTYSVTGITAATGCTNTATAFVNYTPPAPVVSPAAVFMCQGGAPVKIKVVPPTGTNQFCSGPVNIPVPDNTVAGASSSIAVTTNPSCFITGVSVNINMSHTRIGDMIFVLKAPNSQVLSLDYRLSATGNTAASSGFTNTTFSSNGIVALSTGTSPYTGVFRPDAQTAAAGGLGLPGPAGMVPSATNFAQLLSVPNGNWTLGFYDAATGETGTLTSWCISFTYSCGTGVATTQAVWSPMAGLFYDYAATLPYTGLAIDSVWTWPSPSGVYTYQVVTQALPTPSVAFTNPTAISIPVGGAATAYPASLPVSGLPATGVSIRSIVLNNFNHTKSEDVDIVLQSPTGQNMILMSDVGSGATANATYTFMDSGPAMSITAPNATGTYKPTNNGTPDNFPAPGPGSITQTAPAINTFTGNLNGTWKLFVLDDDGTADQGTIAGGYTINFDLGSPPCTSLPRSVVVTVGLPTTIVTQPVNQSVCTDKVASFTVVAGGTGLTYQWQVTTNGGVTFLNITDGGVYSGATTATLTITAPPISMSGYRYRVIINGSVACATVVSNAATLTVNPLPVIVIYTHPYHKLLPGLTTTLASIVTPNAAAAYTWFHDGLVVPGATADTLLVDFNNIGLYQLRVIDINGCTNVSDTMSIRDSALGKMFVFPNPSSGRFQVRYYNTPNTASPRTLTVYDNTGQRTITRSFTQTISYERLDIDVRSHGKGLYWVELTDKDGKRLGLSRLLVQ
ncbi:T9SS type A sorting domain-containing protein [Ferruginibacter sp. SUN106]|uniref:T9SS type A sorting domain-containing protein n=1 Tax=Ferruginibacter sp. SUN106 TaxID=2978348 RepID=UPI003D35E1CA